MTTNESLWAPYRPNPADPWDLRKVAHLHRRAGFGATWTELQRDLKDGPTASVDRFLDPPKPSADEQEVLAGLRQSVLRHHTPGIQRDPRLQAWWLYQILYSRDPLREKLTLFWHGHFATSIRKVQQVDWMLRQNETLRRLALDGFAEMLGAIIADPAMLIWLDGGTSRKERPNENFAREFLELFTLGVGHYTEKDIREAARAFTGWALLPVIAPIPGQDRNGTYHDAPFDSSRFDEGTKTFLNKTGAWKASDVVRITLEQPAAAEFLCRKLYRFFVSENGEAPAELIRPLAHELRTHGYSINHVIGVILRSRHFYDPAVYRQRIKGPIEFSAGLVRSLEVPREQLNLFALISACERQGQELFAPPSVKGWDGSRTWLNTATVLERANWANDLLWGTPELNMAPYDPVAWARQQGISITQDGDALTQLLLQQDLAPKASDLVGRAASDGTADGLRKAVQLLVHCPEYQLA